MNDKSLRKLAIKTGDKITREIFLNKRKRKKHKELFLIAQKYVLKNADFSVKPVLKQEYEERMLHTSILSFSVKGLEMVKNAEQRDKETHLTNCKFVLFKKGKSLVFKSTFLKPLLDNKKRTSYFYFPHGFPKNTKKKAYIYKGIDKFKSKEYRNVDKGIFKQKILDFKTFTIKHKGEKEDYNFKLTILNKEKQSYWAENYE